MSKHPNEHWILAILADLQEYAIENDLPTVSQHLSSASMAAVEELSIKDDDGLSVRSRTYYQPGGGYTN